MSIKNINTNNSKSLQVEQKFFDLALEELNDKCLEIQTKLKKDKEEGILDSKQRIELSSVVNKDNIKTYITYFIRGTDIVKKTRTVRVETVIRKVNLAIERRKKWAKFGRALNGNDGITMTKDDVYFMKPDGSYLFKSDELKDKQNRPVPKVNISSANKPKAWKSKRLTARNNDPGNDNTERNKYQFKSKRDDNDKTLFVSNLSDETDDSALYTIFGKYGKVKFINMPTYRNGPRSGESKGIAFVKFFNITTAEKALEENGSYLHHMKIGVKMAGKK
jgi:hypothetical protein